MSRTVLIIEDSATQARIIARMFAQQGCLTVVASSLAEARAQLDIRDFYLILADIFLGQDNILDHMAELRERARGTPIGIMSAGQRNDPVIIRTMLNKARREQADYLLPKPFSYVDVKQICTAIDQRALPDLSEQLAALRA
ncbi:response regulator [Asticcacaulis sp. AND118]|uniref:response regulator n=1 Tax=Asticcacaulis sp. AND118 TaxID=2840468 RepID=UPI001D00002E|nr:response regulator [Asticcacaulis sp. AND118]UDF04504.1 response regulator [Asticcacaulis sp. AND118]